MDRQGGCNSGRLFDKREEQNKSYICYIFLGRCSRVCGARNSKLSNPILTLAKKAVSS